MATLHENVAAFIDLVTGGQSLEAMDRYYAADTIVFENRELARAGKAACLAFERKALASQPEPPRIQMLGLAVNESSGTVFIEWLIRFYGRDGRPMRLEEVAVQQWSAGLICQERFYYEGFVDEGDEDPLPSELDD
jgi:ketosteroid isomerase-like protein